MPDPVDELGIKCPNFGKFYVCLDKPTRFVGCCTIDPCGTATGVCPERNLEPTSFDPSAYNKIRPQECVVDRDDMVHIASTNYNPDIRWYTCHDTAPPFMGCCSKNPCQDGGCPAGLIWPAQLSEDDAKAALFLNQTMKTTETKTGVVTTATATAIPGGGNGNGNGNGADAHAHAGLSKVGIAGVSVASAAVALLIGLVIYLFVRGMRKRKRLHSNNDSSGGGIVDGFPGHSPADEYQESKMSSANSPYSQTSPMMPQQQQQQLFTATNTISELPEASSQQKTFNTSGGAGSCALSSITSESSSQQELRQNPLLFELEDSSLLSHR